MEIWAGFLIGFLGSFHCVGMCGPIALALPIYSQSKFQIMIGRIVYNLGRVTTYSFFGAMFGLFGNRLILIGLQQKVSIGLGVIIIVAVLMPQKYKNKILNFSIIKDITTLIKELFGKLISKKSHKSMLMIGILNGFLPCGFVYVAIAGAITTDNFISGAAFMALFGIGTMPIMVGTAMVGKFLNVNIKRRINKLIPVFAIILALVFILRGLNLGIPYLSPKISNFTENVEEINCH